MKNKENNKLVIFILVLAVVILGAYIIYDRILSEARFTDITILSSNKITYMKKYKFNAVLPVIRGKSNDIYKLNSKIQKDYNRILQSIKDAYKEGWIQSGDNYYYNYTYLIRNNVLVINCYTSVDLNSEFEWKSSGNGLFKFDYFYDIKNDKILSRGEATQKIGITDLDGAKKYSDLNDVCSLMHIEGEGLNLEYSPGGC